MVIGVAPENRDHTAEVAAQVIGPRRGLSVFPERPRETRPHPPPDYPSVHWCRQRTPKSSIVRPRGLPDDGLDRLALAALPGYGGLVVDEGDLVLAEEPNRGLRSERSPDVDAAGTPATRRREFRPGQEQAQDGQVR